MQVVVKDLLRSIFYASIAYFIVIVPLSTFIFSRYVPCSNSETCSTFILALAPYPIIGLSFTIYMVFTKLSKRIEEIKTPFTSTDKIFILIASAIFISFSYFTQPLVELNDRIIVPFTRIIGCPSGADGAGFSHCAMPSGFIFLIIMITHLMLLYNFLKTIYSLILKKK